MTRGWAGAVVLAMGISGLVAGTASAEPPAPVVGVRVFSGVEAPGVLGNGAVTYAKVSWAGEDPTVESVYVCVEQGSHAARPGSCDMAREVPAPKLHTDRIELRTHRTYTVSVFAYRAGEYSSPVKTTVRGTRLDGRGAYYTTYGDRIRLEVTLTDSRTGTPLRGRRLQLWASPTQRRLSWSRVTGTTTRAGGNAHVVLTAKRRSTYLWRSRGEDGELATSMTATAYVDYRLTAQLTRTTAGAGDTVKMFGVVRPKTVDKKVTLLKYSAACQGYGVTTVRTTARKQRLPDGRRTFGYVINVPTGTSGTSKYEAYAKTDDRLNGGVSAPVALTVTSFPSRRPATRGGSRAAPSIPTC